MTHCISIHVPWVQQHELTMVLMSIVLERGFNTMVDANMLASQIMQGVVMNASLISIFAQCDEVLDLMVFHLQNVKETYTIAQQPLQLRNIQTWFNAAMRCDMDSYSPLCFPYPRLHRLRIGKNSRPRP